MFDDVICTISTAAGESAIGIVRLTGIGALELINKFFKTPQNKNLSDFMPRYMAYGHIEDNDKVYDEVMAVYYKPPYSYTKEPMVEIFAHGNYISLLNIQQLLIENGARPADRGEFTKRAFLNGRIDLSQAEAVMDVISAKTKRGFDIASKQLSGTLKGTLLHIGDELTELMAQIEVVIDYPDEDVEIISEKKVLSALENMYDSVSDMAASYKMGKIIKEGISVVIVGRPNVGKSSLMNALLKDERAIVTSIAGTTRDVIEAPLSVKGIPVRLIDTAGIRDTEDEVEKIGVEKTKMYFNDADLVLIVLNYAEALTDEDKQILNSADPDKCIIIVNKMDLEKNLEIEYIKKILGDVPLLYTSAISDMGIKDIESHIESLVIAGDINLKTGEVLMNSRHYHAILSAQHSIKQAIDALKMGMTLELIEVDIISAYQAIGEITGQTTGEDVIQRIFDKFCLGK